MNPNKTLSALLAVGLAVSLAGCGVASSAVPTPSGAGSAAAGSAASSASSAALSPADTMTVCQLVKTVNVINQNDAVEGVPGSYETTYEYNEYGELVTKTVNDFTGTDVYTYEYDAAGNQISVIDRMNGDADTDTVTASTYNADGQKISEIYSYGSGADAVNMETVYTYSADLPAAAKNLPATKTSYQGLAADGTVLSVTEYVYDENFFPVSEVSTYPEGMVMTAAYENDEHGNPTKTTTVMKTGSGDPITTVYNTEYTYDAAGAMLSESSDSNPLTITYTYDGAGYRLTETYTDAAGNVAASVTNTYTEVAVKTH